MRTKGKSSRGRSPTDSVHRQSRELLRLEFDAFLVVVTSKASRDELNGYSESRACAVIGARQGGQGSCHQGDLAHAVSENYLPAHGEPRVVTHKCALVTDTVLELIRAMHGVEESK